MDQKKAFTAMDSTLQAFVSILLRFLVVGLAVTRLLYLFAYGVNDFASAGICVAIFLLIEFFCRRLDFNFTKINLLHNTYGSFVSLQPTAIFYSIGFAGWVLLFSAGVYYVKGIGRLASPLLLLLGYWLTLLLSPVFCEFRYAYCLVLCAPVSLALSLGECGE